MLFFQTRYFHDSWVGTDTPGHGESEFADENVQILQGNWKNQVFRSPPKKIVTLFQFFDHSSEPQIRIWTKIAGNASYKPPGAF